MLWADLEEAGLTLKVEDRWKRRAVRHVPEIYYMLYIIYYIYVNRKDHMQRVPLSQRHGSQYNSAKQIIMFDFSFDDF